MGTSIFEQVESNVANIQAEIAAAAALAGRLASDVTLVAVTKRVSAQTIARLYQLGIRDFGERTVQDLARKCTELGSLAGVRWHLIGHLQRNKVPLALASATAIHSLDSLRLAREIVIQAQRRTLLPQLYVEVNLTAESTKTGVRPEDVQELLAFADAQGLPVSGLMTIAAPTDSPEGSRAMFRQLRILRDEYSAAGLLPASAGLSMGMSNDFTVAVEEGATVIRVGSRLFAGC